MIAAKDFSGDSSARFTLTALKDTGVVVFGAGSGGHFLAEFFARAAVPIVAFLDNFRRGGSCCGRPVWPAGISPAKAGLSPELPVIISAVNFSAYGDDDAEQGRQQLLAAGWRRVRTRPEWLAGLFHEHRADLDLVSRIWADDKSLVLYRQALNFLATRAREMEPPVQADAYFADDVPGLWSRKNNAGPQKPLRWVQGGAYIGDSLLNASAIGLAIEEAALFEPDLVNYRELAGAVGRLGVRASCWPCGLWASAEYLRFKAGRGPDNFIDPEGEALIQGLDLDSALPVFNPTLITLDVEGAEIKALAGMERIIIARRPTLAVSIYHRPDDWWVIPGRLWELNEKYGLGYAFYLRVHAPEATDAVMYAVGKTI